MMLSRITALFLLLAVASCATASESDYFNNRGCSFYGQSFCTAAIGNGVYISNGPDFLVYNFHFDEKTVLAIYEGDYPQEYGPGRYVEKQVGQTTIKYRDYDDGETFHRYFLNESLRRPRFLHMMSPTELNAGQREFVEYALSTLKYCKPSGASMICD